MSSSRLASPIEFSESDAPESSSLTFTDADWEGISEAEPVLPEAVPDLPADSAPKDTTEKICPVCNEEIVREPGKKGRLPTYHPQCRPSSTKGSSGTGTRLSAKASRAEYEAELAVEAFASKVRKGALLLSVASPYDAYAIMAGLPDVCGNLRGVLIRYEWARREMLAIEGTGSLLGLIVSVGMILLPILAHHKMIPGKTVRTLMMNLPFAVIRMQRLLAEGSDRIMEVMEQQMAQHMKAQQEAAQAKATTNAANGQAGSQARS